MLKSQILEKLHKKNHNLNLEDIELLFNIFIRKITNSLKHGHNIEIRGFGTFSKKYIRPRKFINPKTKELSYLGETETIHFKPSKKLTKIL